MKVLDSKVENGEVWFKVELQRNTDVLAKELYTREDVVRLNKEEVAKFLKWQSERMSDMFYLSRAS